MGANYISKHLVDLSEAELHDKFSDMRSEAEDYSGHQEGYTGNWNVISDLSIDRTRIFQTSREASEYLVDRIDRSCAEALLVLKTSTKLTPQRVTEILTARKAMDTLVADERRKTKDGSGWNAEHRADLAWIKAVVAKLKAGKSKTRGCARCGSQIAVSYIKAPDMRGGRSMPIWDLRDTISGALACPVCCTSEFCVSDTDRSKKASFLKAEQKAEKELEQKIQAVKKKAKYPEMFVYMGGLARS